MRWSLRPRRRGPGRRCPGEESETGARSMVLLRRRSRRTLLLTDCSVGHLFPSSSPPPLVLLSLYHLRLVSPSLGPSPGPSPNVSFVNDLSSSSWFLLPLVPFILLFLPFCSSSFPSPPSSVPSSSLFPHFLLPFFPPCSSLGPSATRDVLASFFPLDPDALPLVLRRVRWMGERWNVMNSFMK